VARTAVISRGAYDNPGIRPASGGVVTTLLASVLGSIAIAGDVSDRHHSTHIHHEPAKTSTLSLDLHRSINRLLVS
jgi:hypothetical protein